MGPLSPGRGGGFSFWCSFAGGGPVGRGGGLSIPARVAVTRKCCRVNFRRNGSGGVSGSALVPLPGWLSLRGCCREMGGVPRLISGPERF
jgi:hypothetical protein